MRYSAVRIASSFSFKSSYVRYFSSHLQPTFFLPICYQLEAYLYTRSINLSLRINIHLEGQVASFLFESIVIHTTKLFNRLNCDYFIVMARSRIPHAASSGFARIQWCSILGLVIGALLFTVLSSSILLTPDGEIALALRDANITTNLVTVQPPVLGVFDSQLDGSSEIYRAMPTKYMKVLLAFDNHSVPGREVSLLTIHGH